MEQLQSFFKGLVTTFPNALPGTVSQGLIWGVMAIGVFITYKILDFADLTVDGSFSTGGAVMIMLTLAGVPIPIAMLCAFVAGCFAGLITGLLNTLLGIPGILAGILTQIALYSVNYTIMGKSIASVSVDQYPLFISMRRTAVSNGFIVVALEVGKIVLVVAAIIAALYWFFGTEYGFTIRATGCNSNMSRAQGISTKKSTVIALVLSNGLVGLAGGLLAQYSGSNDVNTGRGAIVIGLAAVIIGDVLGSAILKKHFNFIAKLSFTALGGIIYFMVLSIVMLTGISSVFNKLFSAVVVAIFLAVPYINKSIKTSYKRAARNAARALAVDNAGNIEKTGEGGAGDADSD